MYVSGFLKRKIVNISLKGRLANLLVPYIKLPAIFVAECRLCGQWALTDEI